MRLEVRDDGAGLAPAGPERELEPFAQLRGDGGPTGGLGIGLTLVRRVVELEVRSVRAESAGPGRGSAFVVSLPEG